MKPRYGIIHLVLLIAFFSVSFAAIKHASAFVGSSAFTLVVLLFGAGVLRGIARKEIGWTGFGLFGILYLVFGLNDNPPLLTGYALKVLGKHIAGLDNGWTFYTPYSAVMNTPPDSSRLFVLHSVFALAFGMLGAFLGRYFATPTSNNRD